MGDGCVCYSHRVLMVPTIVTAAVVVIVRISAVIVWIVGIIRVVRLVVRVSVPVAIAAVVLAPIP